MAGAIRIISGRWRGSKLAVPDLVGLRPTSDRARETLFNWLAPWLTGATCLDLFAGTGALGLEAASRGADKVVLVDSSRQAAALMRETTKRLGGDLVEVVCATAEQILETASQRFDIVFVDPPFDFYETDLIEGLLQGLDKSILKPDGWIYLEHPRAIVEVPVPSGWRLHREKSMGEVSLKLYQWGE